MSAALGPRGPDASGIHSAAGIGFAHRRLSIIDLSTDSDQPMFWADGRFAITYNGEVYNYKELRSELERLGATFRTHSDTEVVLAGYAYWGADVVNRLRGMFAGAIYDRDQQKLFLFRDPFGEKPLFFSRVGNGVVFASELKALLLCADVSRTINLRALDRFLAFQYVPGPETIFESISHLPPACHLTIHADGTHSQHRYWTVPEAETRSSKPFPELAAELRERMTQAIRRQTVADVPVGVMLSGGVDSGCIVAALHEHGSEPASTFTVGFRDSDIDERDAAQETASRFNTTHHEVIVSTGILDQVQDISRRFDQPFSDPAAIPLFGLSELMKSKVKVALSGDGGDEIMLGYSRYLGVKAAAMADALPAAATRQLRKLASSLPFEKSSVRLLRYMQRLLIELGKPEEERYADWICVFGDTNRASLYSDAHPASARAAVSAEIKQMLSTGESALERAAHFDLEQYLPYDLLMKTDMMSMSHGLEVRCPYLDRDLVDFAARIPTNRRLPLLETKWLMRAAYDDILPDSVLALPKRGLSVPLAQWLRGPLKELVFDSLSPEAVTRRGILAPSTTTDMLNRMNGGDASDQYRLWCLFSLDMWYQNWVDTPPEAY